MITSNVDVSAFDELKGKVLSAANVDSLLREIAGTMLSQTKNRIHPQSGSTRRADGSSLGNYKPDYLALRKRKINDSSPNIKFVYSSLMEGDYKVVPLSPTEYGLGFSNPKNLDKADWLEQRFGKVWALTTEELDKVRDIIKEYLATKLK